MYNNPSDYVMVGGEYYRKCRTPYDMSSDKVELVPWLMSQKYSMTTKQDPTAMQRHTNFPLTGPLRASTGRSRTLSQTDKSARLSGSCKISIVQIY